MPTLIHLIIDDTVLFSTLNHPLMGFIDALSHLISSYDDKNFQLRGV